MMTNGDRERRIFQSHPHTNNGFFFLLIQIPHLYIDQPTYFLNTLSCDINRIMLLQRDDYVTCFSTYLCSIFIFPAGWYGVCEIQFSHMGKTAETLIWCSRKHILAHQIGISVVLPM